MGIIVGIIWIVLCFVVASGAKNRNRSYGGFFALSFFLSPLISFFILIALGENKNVSTSVANSETENTEYKCPHCNEELPFNMAECPHCGKKITN